MKERFSVFLASVLINDVYCTEYEAHVIYTSYRYFHDISQLKCPLLKSFPFWMINNSKRSNVVYPCKIRKESTTLLFLRRRGIHFNLLVIFNVVISLSTTVFFYIYHSVSLQFNDNFCCHCFQLSIPLSIYILIVSLVSLMPEYAGTGAYARVRFNTRHPGCWNFWWSTYSNGIIKTLTSHKGSAVIDLS